MNHFKITVIHNGEQVDVFPTSRSRIRGYENDTSFEDVCKRIGMMVMSNGIAEITIYRDGQTYRTAQVTQHNEAQVKA